VTAGTTQTAQTAQSTHAAQGVAGTGATTGRGTTGAAGSYVAAGGVKGAQIALTRSGGKAAGGRGGVLGAFATLGRTARHGTLPFTGFPLWIAVLAAIVLVAGGLALVRRTRTQL
jgi:hypothetical protein